MRARRAEESLPLCRLLALLLALEVCRRHLSVVSPELLPDSLLAQVLVHLLDSLVPLVASHLLASLVPPVDNSPLGSLGLPAVLLLDSTRLLDDNHFNTQTKSTIMRFI